MFGLPTDSFGRAQVDHLLADTRVRLLRKLGERGGSEGTEGELQTAADEDSAAMLVSVALPAEQQRIRDLLALIPGEEESKTRELLRALAYLWAVHPREEIVIFTTYLGSVDALQDAIGSAFPEAGVGAKVAAEKRFKRLDGPNVLICTAAGREGINLQFARVLFNHDLPWNPMDLDRNILSFDIAELAESAPECTDVVLEYPRVEESDERHRSLLCPRRASAHNRRTGHRHKQIPPCHSITSSTPENSIARRDSFPNLEQWFGSPFRS
jgi:hypothetical protein